MLSTPDSFLLFFVGDDAKVGLSKAVTVDDPLGALDILEDILDETELFL